MLPGRLSLISMIEHFSFMSKWSFTKLNRMIMDFSNDKSFSTMHLIVIFFIHQVIKKLRLEHLIIFPWMGMIIGWENIHTFIVMIILSCFHSQFSTITRELLIILVLWCSNVSSIDKDDPWLSKFLSNQNSFQFLHELNIEIFVGNWS